ncbi:MAG: cytochrome c [Planctomycetes bacterium]|nr:cytochrome c [Planctomycetota bacterium]
MKTWTTLGLFIVMCACVTLAACGGDGKAGNGGGNKPGGSGKKEETLRMPVPAEFKDKKPPKDLTDADFIAKGKDLYHDATKANCIMCHGEGGKGDGPQAANYTDPKVADLTSAAFQDAVTDQYIFWRITDPNNSKAYPNSAMLGYPAGSEEDHWALVAYVRSLKGK